MCYLYCLSSAFPSQYFSTSIYALLCHQFEWLQNYSIVCIFGNCQDECPLIGHFSLSVCLSRSLV